MFLCRIVDGERPRFFALTPTELDLKALEEQVRLDRPLLNLQRFLTPRAERGWRFKNWHSAGLCGIAKTKARAEHFARAIGAEGAKGIQ